MKTPNPPTTFGLFIQVEAMALIGLIVRAAPSSAENGSVERSAADGLGIPSAESFM